MCLRGARTQADFMRKRKGSVINVALVDEQPVVRKGIAVTLSSDSGLRLVASAATVEEAARDSLGPPNVFVIDTASVPTTIREIRRRFPGAKTVVFASAESETRMRQAIRAGAEGYLVKSSSEEDFIRAIKVAYAGGVDFGAPASRKLVSDDGKGRRDTQHVLTPREREVLKLVADGHTSRDIALRLQVSVRTVHSHREHISRKLGIRSVAGLTRFAVANGLVPSN